MEYTCEICGRKTTNPYVVFIEGARLIVCERCARRYKNAEPLRKQKERMRRVSTPRKKISEKTFEIVEGYGSMIRKAREKRRLKIEELAKAVAEPESEIRKIEREEIVPEIKVAQKLEKFLGIKLVREITEEELEKEEEMAKKLESKRQPITLGDIVVIKKKR